MGSQFGYCLLLLSVSAGFFAGRYFGYKVTEKAYVLNPAPVKFQIVDPVVSLGSNEQITIIEFYDLECPYSARNNEAMKTLFKQNQGKIRYYFIAFPLTSHENAPMLAKAVLAASLQGKAYEMKDAIFGVQKDIRRGANPDTLVIKIAAQLGLNIEKFDLDRNSIAVTNQLNSEIEEGKRQKVSATPTTFVNGFEVNGAVGLNVYDKIIEYFCLKQRIGQNSLSS